MKIKSVVLSLMIAVLFVTGCAQVSPATPPPDIPVANAGGIGDGNVVALGLVQTIQYLNLVMRSDPMTGVMSNPAQTQFMLYWAMKSNVGWMGINSTGGPSEVIKQFCGSNCSNPFTFTDLYNYLKANGWQEVAPSVLPGWMVTTFGSVTAFMSAYGNLTINLPAIMVAPGGDFVNPYHTGNG